MINGYKWSTASSTPWLMTPEGKLPKFIKILRRYEIPEMDCFRSLVQYYWMFTQVIQRTSESSDFKHEPYSKRSNDLNINMLTLQTTQLVHPITSWSENGLPPHSHGASKLLSINGSFTTFKDSNVILYCIVLAIVG